MPTPFRFRVDATPAASLDCTPGNPRLQKTHLETAEERSVVPGPPVLPHGKPATLKNTCFLLTGTLCLSQKGRKKPWLDQSSSSHWLTGWALADYARTLLSAPSSRCAAAARPGALPAGQLPQRAPRPAGERVRQKTQSPNRWRLLCADFRTQKDTLSRRERRRKEPSV